MHQPVASGLPTLLISGSFDTLTSLAGAKAAAAKLSHATIISIPGIGHFVSPASPCAQDPDRVVPRRFRSSRHILRRRPETTGLSPCRLRREASKRGSRAYVALYRPKRPVAKAGACALEEGHDQAESADRPLIVVLPAARTSRAAARPALDLRAAACHQCRAWPRHHSHLARRRHDRLSLFRGHGRDQSLRRGGDDPRGHGAVWREPTTNGGEIFAGLYAIYCGLLLIGVTGLILSPVFHRVMHQLHLPDQEDPDEGKPKPKPKRSSSAKRDSS